MWEQKESGGQTSSSLIRRYVCTWGLGQRVTSHAKANRLRPQGIDVLSTVLSVLGLSAEDRETEAKFKLTRFVCELCDSPIVMNFQRLVFSFRAWGHFLLLNYHV